MREGVAALYLQIQLVDEREKGLVVKQKLLDLGAKSRVLLSFEKELEAKTISLLILDKSLGAAFRQGEANRRILRELLPPFAPILHQGDVRRTPPTHTALKVVRHHAFEGFADPDVLHSRYVSRCENKELFLTATQATWFYGHSATGSVFVNKHQTRFRSKGDFELEIVKVVFFDVDCVGLPHLQVLDGEIHIVSTFAVAGRPLVQKEDGNVLTLQVDFLVERLGAAVERCVGGIDSHLRVVNSGHVYRIDIRIVIITHVI